MEPIRSGQRDDEVFIRDQDRPGELLRGFGL
jgi:hypothetical protein